MEVQINKKDEGVLLSTQWWSDDKKHLYREEIDMLKGIFEEYGFIVSANAIRHQFKYWKLDFKSYYVGRGYVLWSPCGCNQFEMWAKPRSCYDKEFKTCEV